MFFDGMRGGVGMAVTEVLIHGKLFPCSCQLV